MLHNDINNSDTNYDNFKKNSSDKNDVNNIDTENNIDIFE